MSNSKFSKKSKKNKKTGFELTDHLIEAIKKDELIVGKSNTGNWLELLSDEQLLGFSDDIETFIKTDIEIEANLLGVMINLLMLEMGPVDKIEILESELFERFKLLFVLCQFEKLSRDGLITNFGGSKTISGNIDRSFSYDLTVSGIIEARQEGANVLLVSRLKAINDPVYKDSVHNVTVETKTILMRLAMNYLNFLQNKEWQKAKALLKWAEENRDPLAVDAINLVNTFFAEELGISYESLPEKNRLSFLLDNPDHVEKFLSIKTSDLAVQLLSQDEELSQNIEDLYSQENTLLLDNYMFSIGHSK